jgi:hypothetical protein
MPHDINGRELKQGDIVTLRARVENIYSPPSGCNVRVVAIDGPPEEYKPSITCNAKSVLLAAPPAEPIEAPGVDVGAPAGSPPPPPVAGADFASAPADPAPEAAAVPDFDVSAAPSEAIAAPEAAAESQPGS